MKLIQVIKGVVAPTKTKVVAAGAALSLIATNAFAVLSTEATALVTAADAQTSEVKEVAWAVGPGVIGIVGAVAVIVIVIAFIKRGK